jgi:hypothetical protein
VSPGEHSPPRSPTFSNSPDYSQSDRANNGEGSRSESLPDFVRLLEEATAKVELAKTETAEAERVLDDLQRRYHHLRSRVIYVEGELAVYQRLAPVHYNPPQAPPLTYRVLVAPPPPPPRRF